MNKKAKEDATRKKEIKKRKKENEEKKEIKIMRQEKENMNRTRAEAYRKTVVKNRLKRVRQNKQKLRDTMAARREMKNQIVADTINRSFI